MIRRSASGKGFSDTNRPGCLWRPVVTYTQECLVRETQVVMTPTWPVRPCRENSIAKPWMS